LSEDNSNSHKPSTPLAVPFCVKELLCIGFSGWCSLIAEQVHVLAECHISSNPRSVTARSSVPNSKQGTCHIMTKVEGTVASMAILNTNARFWVPEIILPEN